MQWANEDLGKNIICDTIKVILHKHVFIQKYSVNWKLMLQKYFSMNLFRIQYVNQSK